MTAAVSDPTLWVDDLGNTPPIPWQLLASDSRWWYSSASYARKIRYIGEGPLPATLSFTVQITQAASSPYQQIRLYYSLDGTTQSPITVGTTTGSYDISISTATFGVAVFRWWISTGSGDMYGGVAAVSGPAVPVYSQGNPIRIVERDVLDTFYPGWMNNPPTVTTAYQHYVMDDNDPLAFWLHPRATTGVDVYVTHAGVPATISATSDTLTLSNMYTASIVDYVVYRALSKDSRGAAPGVAEKYRDKFLLALGATRQVLKAIGQNTHRPPDAEE